MGVIKNYNELATTKKRRQALDIIEAGIARVNPRFLLRNAVSYNKDFNSVIVYNKHYDLLKGRIFVVGGGKAVGYMAEALGWVPRQLSFNFLAQFQGGQL